MALYKDEEQEPGAGQSTSEISRSQDQRQTLVGREFALAFAALIIGVIVVGFLYLFGGNIVAAAFAVYGIFLAYFVIYSVFALYHLYLWGTDHDASKTMALFYIIGAAVILAATGVMLATADWSVPLQSTIFNH